LKCILETELQITAVRPATLNPISSSSADMIQTECNLLSDVPARFGVLVVMSDNNAAFIRKICEHRG
jgi:hypothetical protein